MASSGGENVESIVARNLENCEYCRPSYVCRGCIVLRDFRERPEISLEDIRLSQGFDFMDEILKYTWRDLVNQYLREHPEKDEPTYADDIWPEFCELLGEYILAENKWFLQEDRYYEQLDPYFKPIRILANTVINPWDLLIKILKEFGSDEEPTSGSVLKMNKLRCSRFVNLLAKFVDCSKYETCSLKQVLSRILKFLGIDVLSVWGVFFYSFSEVDQFFWRKTRDDNCAICLEELTDCRAMLKCKQCHHILHYSCATKLTICPYCRFDGD